MIEVIIATLMGLLRIRYLTVCKTLVNPWVWLNRLLIQIIVCTIGYPLTAVTTSLLLIVELAAILRL
jgi:hypothetical protein